MAHVIGAAIVGAVLSAGAEALSQAINGDGFNVEAILVEAVSGAVFGAIAVATGNTVVANIASAGVRSVTSSCIAGDDLRTTIVDAAQDMVVAGMTSVLLSGSKKLVSAVAPKGGFIANLFYEGKHVDYKSSQTRFVNSVTSSAGNAVTSVSFNTVSSLSAKQKTTPSGVKGVDWWMKYYA